MIKRGGEEVMRSHLSHRNQMEGVLKHIETYSWTHSGHSSNHIEVTNKIEFTLKTNPDHLLDTLWTQQPSYRNRTEIADHIEITLKLY